MSAAAQVVKPGAPSSLPPIVGMASPTRLYGSLLRQQKARRICWSASPRQASWNKTVGGADSGASSSSRRRYFIHHNLTDEQIHSALLEPAIASKIR